MNESIITITDRDGNIYEYDPSTQIITMNGTVLSGQDYEPVFINSTG